MEATDIPAYMAHVGAAARVAATAMAAASTAAKDHALRALARRLRAATTALQTANELDLAAARAAGLPPPITQFTIPAVALVGEERNVRGSYMGSCVPSRDIPRYIDLYMAGKLPVNKLLSSTGPLEEINEAFDRLDRGDVIRHVITM